MNKISLRLKIMIITIIVLVSMALCLTWISVENAQKYYIEHEGENGYNVTRDLNGQKLDSNNKDGLSIFYKLTSEAANEYFIKKSLIYMMIICVVGGILIYFMIDHTLKPLINLDEKMKQINEDNLNQRIEIAGGNDEVVSLSQSFNTMLTRLESSFANQKRFVANVTHELKTPLTIIKTDIEVLKLDKQPTVEDYKENLEVIEKSTERLINVVENLLVLMNENCEELDETISVNELITAVLEELHSIINEKHLVIHKKCDDYYVKGNATLLYRALFNLVENAVKYNKESGEIEIEVKRGGEEIYIFIKDNGMGIPKDCINNVFEAFYRVDSSRARELGEQDLG